MIFARYRERNTGREGLCCFSPWAVIDSRNTA